MKVSQVWAGVMGVLVAGALAWGEEKAVEKRFEPVVLANHFSFVESKQDFDLGCGFLLKVGDRVVAVSAKHILKALKLKGVEGVEHVALEGPLKGWEMFSKEKPGERVVLGKMLNEDKGEKLSSAKLSEKDWVVFEVEKNGSGVKALEARKEPLVKGERLYVVGWTNGQTEGPQRVYAFEYVKTVGTHLLLKDVVVPEKMGGLSGAPVVDEGGKVVGIVSNGTVDPESGKRLFSPCGIEGVVGFVENMKG